MLPMPVWIVLLLCILFVAPRARWDQRYRDCNACITLAASLFALSVDADPPDPRVRQADFLREISSEGGTAPIRSDRSFLTFQGAQYDVLLLVLETGFSGLLDLETENVAWLPTLRQLARRSLYCRRHLAPYPGSTKSIFSIVTGLYPFPDYRSFIRFHPRASLESFAGILQQEGYRTGSYASIDGSYDRMDLFLTEQGFRDQGDVHSLKLTLLSGQETFGDDADLWEAYRQWLSEQPSKPSLFLLLPPNSHWPFHQRESDRVFPGMDVESRYKNTLQTQDRLLGEHLSLLRKTGRLERTIIVVLADHGGYFNLLENSSPHPGNLEASTCLV